MSTSLETISLEQLQQRDRNAWHALYDLLALDLRSFVQRIGASDPDDIVGETMLNIVRDIGTFKGTSEEIRPWAFRIARHRVIDAARRQQRRPREVSLADTDPIDISLTDARGDIDLSRLSDALQSLTLEQKEVLWLRYAMDFSLESTADILGTTPEAVSSMAYRAISRLRQNG